MRPIPARAQVERATLRNLRSHHGVAGQIAISAEVAYGRGPWRPVSFVGSTHGSPGPVVMISDTWGQVNVSAPSRFGFALSEDWVRNFYAG